MPLTTALPKVGTDLESPAQGKRGNSSQGLLTLMTVKFNCLHLTSNPSITAKQKHSWNNKRKQSLAMLQSGTFVAVLMYKESREKSHRP